MDGNENPGIDRNQNCPAIFASLVPEGHMSGCVQSVGRSRGGGGFIGVAGTCFPRNSRFGSCSDAGRPDACAGVQRLDRRIGLLIRINTGAHYVR